MTQLIAAGPGPRALQDAAQHLDGRMPSPAGPSRSDFGRELESARQDRARPEKPEASEVHDPADRAGLKPPPERPREPTCKLDTERKPKRLTEADRVQETPASPESGPATEPKGSGVPATAPVVPVVPAGEAPEAPQPTSPESGSPASPDQPPAEPMAMPASLMVTVEAPPPVTTPQATPTESPSTATAGVAGAVAPVTDAPKPESSTGTTTPPSPTIALPEQPEGEPTEPAALPETPAEAVPEDPTLAGKLPEARPTGESVAPRAVTAMPKLEAPAPPPEVRFAQDNVENIVQGVRTTLLPRGGEMHMRLDPPELGALQVMVKVVDGALTATFTTTNDQATQLLGHSLQQLKSSLEQQGMAVERIAVRQAEPAPQSQNTSNQQQQQDQGRQGWQGQQQQEHQRREMIRQMWARMARRDAVDLVA